MRRARIVICLLFVVLTASGPAGADVRPEGFAECGGTAPATTSCTTGRHLRTLFIVHAVDPAAGYTGTLQSRVAWLLGAHTLRCRYFNGVRQGECTREGAFPEPGTFYRHECDSLAYSSAVPGGTGAWRCFTIHSTGLL